MKYISMTPYTKIENKDYPYEVSFKISKNDFSSVKYDGTKSEFLFIGCKFKDLTIENYEDIVFDKINVSFINCYVDRLQVENIKSENISFYFGNSIVSGRVKSDDIDNIQLNNVIVYGGLFLLGEMNVNISYTEENIFPLEWRKLFKDLHIKSIEDLLKKEQRYYLENTKKLSFSTNQAKEGGAGLIRENFRMPMQSRLRYQLSEAQKEIINIGISLSYDKKVEQSNLKISTSMLHSLSIDGEQNGAMNIENCQIQNLYFRNFSTKGEATIFNIKPLSKSSSRKVEIKQSNLDNTWFDNIDFNDYRPLSFFRTRFGKVRFSSCSFPSDYRGFEQINAIENIHTPDKVSDNYYKDQYEVFLQLKNALESNGNFYESQKLQAISNEALKKIKDVSVWDKSILWINSKSNNHGLSIKRPLFYFLGFTILFYIVYLATLGRIFNRNGFDFSLIGYYFSFIDPTHRAEFLVDKKDFNFGSLTIDFFNRVVSGFFIYQFIAAFRKYGKK